MTKQYHRTAEVARKRHLHFICGLLLFALLISMVPIQAGASDEAIPVTVSSGDTVYPVSATPITGYDLGYMQVHLPVYKVSIPADAGNVTISLNSNIANYIEDYNYTTHVPLTDGRAILTVENLSKYPWVLPIDFGEHITGQIAFLLENNAQITEVLDSTKTNAYAEFTMTAGSYIGVFGLVIEIQDAQSTDKAALDTAIKAAKKLNSDTYYTEGDRYNGSETSETGFWAELQAQLTKSESVFNSGKSLQEEIDAAASALQAAIANLIPKSQVNPTGLYETLNQYADEDEKGYSVGSWAAFEQARSAAQTMLDSLFTTDEDGTVKATEANAAAKQPEADALVQKLQDAKAALKTRVWSTLEPGSENALAGIALYAGYYDTLKETDYTPESWQAYVSARAEALNTAKDHGTFTTTMGTDEVALQSQAFNAVRKAYFSLVPKADTITVRVSLTDELAAKQATSLRVTPRTEKVTVSAGTTVGDLLTNSFKNQNSWRVNSMSQLMVYVNGTLAFWSVPGEYYLDYPQASEYQAFVLHDGDEVTVVRVQMPTMVNISEDLWPMALGRVTDKIRYQTLTTDLVQDEETGAYKAVVGVPFTLTATSKAAMPAHMTDDEAKPTAGAYVFRSAIVDKLADVVGAEILTDTKLKTGADGTLTMTVYQPGWQLINVYNLDSDDAAFVNGGAILIYAEVDESQADLTKIKNDLRAELKKTYENPDYPKECFTEADWQTIETLYKTGMDGIDAAEDAASAYAAQLTAKSGIEALQSKAADTNAKNLADFRALMKRFPEDLTKLDASAVKLIDQLESYYNAMTQYQRDELSVQETKRYNEILAAREGLAAGGAKNYTLTVAYDLSAVPEKDKGGLEAMIKWLQEHRVVDGTNGTTGGTRMAGLFTFNKVNTSQTKVNYEEVTTVDVGTDVYFCANPTYATYFQIRARARATRMA